jgi:hypothetical protein
MWKKITYGRNLEEILEFLIVLKVDGNEKKGGSGRRQ